VLDPQGNAVQQTLKNMGYNNISQVRQGKFFEIEVDSDDVEKTKKEIVEICNNLLTNTVIEEYKITDSKN
jgi:phosphoribosylformylglycinamidine synthase